MKNYLRIAAVAAAVLGMSAAVADECPMMNRKNRQEAPGGGMERREGGGRMMAPGGFSAELEAEFPEEAAKIAAAQKEIQTAMEKIRTVRKAEMEKVHSLVKAWKESKDEAKLAELKGVVGAKVDKLLAYAKKHMEKNQAELDALIKTGVSGKNLESIRAMYERNIARDKELLSKGRAELIEKRIEMLCSDRRPDGPDGKKADSRRGERRGGKFNAPPDGKSGPGNAGPSAPSEDAENSED